MKIENSHQRSSSYNLNAAKSTIDGSFLNDKRDSADIPITSHGVSVFNKQNQQQKRYKTK